MRSAKIDLAVTAGGASNTAVFTIATGVTFTAARAFAFGSNGRLLKFKNHDGDGNLTIVSQVITWAMSAANSKKLDGGSSYKLDIKVGGQWVEAAHGDLDAEGNVFATATNAGGPVAGGAGGGGSASHLPTPWSNGYIQKPGQRSSGATALVPGANTAVFVPWIADRDMTIQGLVYFGGATAAGKLCQAAIYKASATGSRGPDNGAPLAKSTTETANAAANTAAVVVLDTNLVVKRGDINWIALLSSDAACGYAMCSDSQMAELGMPIASGGLSDVNAANILQGCFVFGITYANPVVWPTNLNGARSTHKPDAPTIVLRTAA